MAYKDMDKKKVIYEARKAQGLCVCCGKEREPSRRAHIYCEACAERSNKNKKHHREGVVAPSSKRSDWWEAVSQDKYPLPEVEELLVTDAEGEVYILSRFNESWEDIFPKNLILAWQYLPRPYKVVRV